MNEQTKTMLIMDKIFVAWNSAMDDDFAASFDLEKLKSHVDGLHTNWDSKWGVDEDGLWLRHFGSHEDEHEYIVISPLQFLE